VPEPAAQVTPPRPPLWTLVIAGLLSVSSPVLVGLLIRWLFPSPGARGSFSFLTPFAVVMPIIVLSVVFRSKLQRSSVWMRSVIGAGFGLGVFGALVVVNRRILAELLSDPEFLALPLCIGTVPWGIKLIIRGVKGVRVGDSLHCPKCDYELGVPQEAAPIQCPECGVAWLGRWVKGELRTSPVRVWWGVAMLLPLLLAVATWFSPLGAAGLGMLPTRTVIFITALDAWGHNEKAWAELNKRTLTAADEAKFAESLLDLRRREGYLYGTPSAWMQTAVINGGAAGPLPQALQDRYFEEWFEPAIDIPDQVAQGKPCPILIRGPQRTGDATIWMFMWVEGLTVDGAPADIEYWRALSTGWIHTLYLDPGSRTGQSEFGSRPLMLDTSTPGTRHIHATIYKCVIPRGAVPTDRPVVNGVETPPAGAVYFRRVELEKVVEVGAK